MKASSTENIEAYELYLKGRFNLSKGSLATKLDPLSLSGKFHLGELYYRSERFIDAIETFDEILAKNAFFKQASIFKPGVTCF